MAPTILAVNQTNLDFEFLAWKASADSGDIPSSYLVEIQGEGSENWQNLTVLSGSLSGNITLSLEYDLQPSATYNVRVIPVFEHDREHYRGYGAHANFTVPTPPVFGKSYSYAYKIIIIISFDTFKPDENGHHYADAILESILPPVLLGPQDIVVIRFICLSALQANMI